MNPQPPIFLAGTSAAALSKLLSDDLPGASWQPSELADILQHQLSTPLEGVGISFVQLMGDASPAMDALTQFHTFAKACMSNADAPLPREAAAVFYYGSILLARLRHNVRISQLDDSSLLRGVAWVLGQKWVDPQIPEFFLEGQRAVESDSSRR